MGATEPSDVELWHRVWQVICDARDHIRRLRDEGEYIPRHFKLPTVAWFDSGFPNVSDPAATDAALDYGGSFGPSTGRWIKVAYDEVPSLGALFDYVQNRDDLRNRFGGLEVPDDPEATERFTQVSIAARVLDVLDHVMHTVGDQFDEDDAKAAWIPIEAGLLWDRLPVEIHAPVVLTHFEADAPVEIQPDVRLEPISEDLQRARVPNISWGSAVHSTVLAAATHSFVFLGRELPNEDLRRYEASDPHFYPLDEIDMALSALRLVTGVECGYAHVFLSQLDGLRATPGRL